MKIFYSSFLPLLLFLSAGSYSVQAATELISTGSFIINMGVVPQTIANGLKPYGLVYDLVRNYHVPVKWVISGTKTKDGIDFIHNGVQYRGGTFTVPFEFRTPAVNAEISSWQALGVVGNTSVSDLMLDITKTLFYAPNWTMDKQNGSIAVSYFVNAGIPSSAYGGSSANWKNPSDLGACDDIFVMPHADPTWDTHNNLYYWNMNYKGNIWAACHAVSVMENLKDPTNTIQMNFLSTNGLVLWSDHSAASPPYDYQDHSNPIMQFMQSLDNATTAGSEAIYLPKLSGAWRSTTMVGVIDNSNADVPTLSAGPAAALVFGRAFGDPDRGYVMYEGGHDLDKGHPTESERVAAQRAFFNYSFFVAVDRYSSLATSIVGLPEVIVGNQVYTLSFDIPPGIDLTNYTVSWSSSGGGTFATTGNKQSVNFTAPVAQGATIVTVFISDGCGREVFSSKGSFTSSVLASPARLQGNYQPADGSVQLKWTESDNQSVSHFEIQRAVNNNRFETIAIQFPQSTGEKVNYSYTDKNGPEGISKYRLITHNKATSSTWSNTIKITVGKYAEPQLIIIGNPARSVVTFEYRSPVTESMTATILDISGRRISSKKISIQRGTNRIRMGDLDQHQAGTYLLQVMAGGNTITTKINLIK